MATIKPSALALPDVGVKNLPPRPSGYEGSRELFPRNTGLMFDVITPAVVASDLTISILLDRPARPRASSSSTRIDPALPGLDDVIGVLVDATFKAHDRDAYEAEIAADDAAGAGREPDDAGGRRRRCRRCARSRATR